jgi:anti-anti-sigma factor
MTGASDALNERELRRCFRLFDDQHPVVLDMAATTWIDSVTLALLAETCRRGVDLTVRNTSLLVARVLRASGVATLLAFADDSANDQHPVAAGACPA